MATLTPGISSLNVAVSLPVEYAPNPQSISWGTISVPIVVDGFLYSPPTEGQIWPRGDYAPRG